MSALETLAQPILTPMILGKKTLLTEAMRKIIVEWAVMKFLVSEHEQRNNFITGTADRSAFMSTRTIPSFYKLWIATCGKGKWRDAFIRNSITYSRAEELPEGAKGRNTQSMTWGVGNIFFHHLATTVPGLDFDLPSEVSETVIRLWPSLPGDILWPPAFAVTEEQADVIAYSLERLSRDPTTGWRTLAPTG